jgi:hypothetical protein
MPDTIKIIKDKYNVPNEGAVLIYEAASKGELPLHTIAAIYKSIEREKGKVSNIDLFQGISKFIHTQKYATKPIGTKDNRSTKTVKNIFDENGEIQIASENILDDDGNILVKKGQRIPQKSRFISTRKMLSAEDYKERFVPRNIPPQYFYFDIDMRFERRGHELPPNYDPQFEGLHKGVPYAKVTLKKIVSPSRYNTVPLMNDVGDIIGRGKTKGFRLFDVEIVYKDQSKHFEMEFPYEHLSEFDMMKGVESSNKIYEMVKYMMKNEVLELYNKLNGDKKKKKEMYNDPKYNKNLAKNEMFKLYYGEDYKEERKRKSGKPSSKRKIIKKKTTKRKCVCTPIHKRKLVLPKKRLSIKRRK